MRNTVVDDNPQPPDDGTPLSIESDNDDTDTGDDGGGGDAVQ
jgi:hypothetical protein